jgi:RimJ/RimL family protein N-acetyltransferase
MKMKKTLRLRPCKKADGKFLMKWFADERMMRLWCRDSFTFPLTEKQMGEYYDRLEMETFSWGFTALDEAGTPVGSFQMKADFNEESVHLGFIVVDPKLRGTGAGFEMVSLAVQYAVEILGVKRLTLKVFDTNPGARRCYEKVGFSVESIMEEGFLYHDEMWEVSIMAYTV